LAVLRPRGGNGVCGGVGELWLCLTTAIADSVRLWGTAAGTQCLRLSERFFIFLCVRLDAFALFRSLKTGAWMPVWFN